MRLLFVDGSTKLETVTDLQRKARGGMVASLFHVTDYLASKGHDVTVLSDIQTEGATRAGAKWLHDVWGRYDVLVCNRGVADGYPQIQAKRRVLWTHDLPHSGFIPEPKTITAFDRTVFMSRYAERVWRAFYRDIGRSVLIPNGVDKKIFYPRQKDRKYLIYASAPNRGLDKLPLIFQALKERHNVHMRAYSKLSVLHPNEGEDRFDYDKVRESGIEVLDPIPQEALANQLGQAGLMILPSGYPEICSNIILQSLASGTPVITTGNMGSAHEWTFTVTDWNPQDYMVYTMEVVRMADFILSDEKYHDRLMRRVQRTKIHTWIEVGAMWDRLLSKLA